MGAGAIRNTIAVAPFDGTTAHLKLSWRLQTWTGATLGLFVVRRGGAIDNYADFDAFTVTSHD